MKPRSFLPGCILLLTLLSGGCMTIRVAEDHFFLPGPAQSPRPFTAADGSVEALALTTEDGVDLAGVCFRQPGALYDIIYFGGNAARLDDFGPLIAARMTSLPVNVVYFDYRGYGRSTGTPSIATLKTDALAIHDYWAARAAGRPIVLHGFSLGSFMGVYVADNRRVAGLVLESSAPDVSVWARHQVPFYAKPFVRLQLAPALIRESNAERLRRYSGPLLLMTGEADPVTPPAFAKELAAASASVATVVIVPGATHGTVMWSGLALHAYSTFLRSLGPLPESDAARRGDAANGFGEAPERSAANSTSARAPLRWTAMERNMN